MCLALVCGKVATREVEGTLLEALSQTLEGEPITKALSLWIISNICSNTTADLQCLLEFNSGLLLQKTLSHLDHPSLHVRSNALYTLLNSLHTLKNEQYMNHFIRDFSIADALIDTADSQKLTFD